MYACSIRVNTCKVIFHPCVLKWHVHPQKTPQKTACIYEYTCTNLHSHIHSFLEFKNLYSLDWFNGWGCAHRLSNVIVFLNYFKSMPAKKKWAKRKFRWIDVLGNKMQGLGMVDKMMLRTSELKYCEPSKPTGVKATLETHRHTHTKD